MSVALILGIAVFASIFTGLFLICLPAIAGRGNARAGWKVVVACLVAAMVVNIWWLALLVIYLYKTFILREST